MITFQNKKVDKFNEQQIKMAKIQHIKKIYEQNISVNLAKIQKQKLFFKQKQEEELLFKQKQEEELLFKQDTSKNSLLQNYILSVYGK